MKAFVFKPSNANIGNFEVSTIDQLAEALMKFGESHLLSAFDYVECSGKTWTLVSGQEGLELVEGRAHPSDSESADGSSTASDARADISTRYQDAYTTARAIIAIGGVIKGIGIAFGIIVILVGLMASAITRESDSAMLIFGSFILAALGGMAFYVSGVFVSAQGQILMAALDSAVNSSPFLTNEQRVSVMRL